MTDDIFEILKTGDRIKCKFKHHTKSGKFIRYTQDRRRLRQFSPIPFLPKAIIRLDGNNQSTQVLVQQLELDKNEELF